MRLKLYVFALETGVVSMVVSSTIHIHGWEVLEVSDFFFCEVHRVPLFSKKEAF